MKLIKFYVDSLKKILQSKQYAINRVDLDQNFSACLEKIHDELASIHEKNAETVGNIYKAIAQTNNAVNIKFAVLDSSAVLPTNAKPGDAGLDLTAISNGKLSEDKSYYEYDFGLSVEIPEGYVGLIFPRSSITKTDLLLANCVGVIDSGYRGPLTARFRSVAGQKPRAYQSGDRIAQLVVLPFPKVNVEKTTYEQLSKTERGSGGFGSSGA